MILKRKLGLTELEQRIAPAHTITLDAVTTFFDLQPDADGDVVRVERDNTAPQGDIDITDNDATGPGDFDEIDSIVFDASCDATTNLVVRDINPGVGNDTTTVGYIDFTAPAAVGSITLGVSGTSTVNVVGLNNIDSIGGTTLNILTVYGDIDSIGTGDGIDLSSAFSGTIIVNGNINAAGTGDGLEFDSAFTGTATVNGNINAAGGTANAAYFDAGLGGSLIVTGNLTGGNASAIWVEGGDLAGTINVGNMPGRTIDQAGAFDITGAGITVGGNLGGIIADGSIVNTTVDVGGSLTNIQADFGGGGADTITNLTLIMSGGGDVTGSIDNNGAAQAMSLSVTSTAGGAGDGDFSGNIVSGGSLDLDFDIDDEFSGAITAQSGMALDFHADDMDGDITATTGNIVFDGTDDFIVDATMSDDLRAITGDIQFINGSTFDVGTMTGFADVWADAGSIIFTDSTIDVTWFNDGAEFDAGAAFTFNGDDTTGSTFNVGTFSGDLQAGTAVTFEDAVMDWGNVTGNGRVTAGTSVFFIDGSLIADDFGGTVNATANDIDFTDFTFEADDSGPGNGDFDGAFAANLGSILVTDSLFTVDGDFSGTWDADTAITFDPSSFTTDVFSGTWTVATGDMVFDNSTFEATTTMSGDLIATTGDIQFINSSTFTVGTMTGTGSLNAGTDILFTDSDVAVATFSDNANFTAGTNFTFYGDDVAYSTFDVTTFAGDIIATAGAVTFEDADMDWGDVQGTAQVTAGTDVNFTDGTLDALDFAGTVTATAGDIDVTDFAIDIDSAVDGVFSGAFAAGNNIEFDPSSFTTYDFSGSWTATNDMTFTASDFVVINSMTGHLVATTGSVIFESDDVVTPSTFTVNTMAAAAYLEAGTNILFDGSDFNVTTMDGDLLTTAAGGGSIIFQADVAATPNASTFTVGTMSGTGSLTGDGNVTFIDSTIAITDFQDGANFTATTGAFTFNGDNTTPSTFDVGTFSGDIMAATTITFTDADMDWGTVDANADIQATLGNLTFSAGTLDVIDFFGDVDALDGNIVFSTFAFEADDSTNPGVVGNLGGTFDAADAGSSGDDGDIQVTNSTFIVDNDTSSVWNAARNITFDPSSFTTFDFSGAWTAAVDMTFDASIFQVLNDMSGSLTATAGKIEFINSSTYDVNTMTATAFLNAGTDILFTASDLTVVTFSDDANFTAANNFTFDGSDTNNFTITTFDGDIIATAGDVTFVNGTFDFGTFNATGKVEATAGDIFFGDDDDPDSFDTFHTTLFEGTLAAPLGEVLFTEMNLVWDGGFGGIIIAGELNFVDGSLTIPVFYGTFEATGLGGKSGDITFDNFPIHIDDSTGGTGDFSGAMIAAHDIHFTDSSFTIDGDFTATGLLQAGNHIIFDPSPFEADNFYGTWTAASILMDAGSHFTVHRTMDGLVEATGAAPDGFITFQDSNFYIETFGSVGQFIANTNFTFDGDGTSTFEIDFFEGDIIATTANVTFIDGTFDFGDFEANADVTATAGDILFGDDDASNDTFTAAIFGGEFEADNITFTEMTLDFGIFDTSGELDATTALTFQDNTSFNTTQFDGTLHGSTLTLDHVDFDFGDFSQNGLFVVNGGDLFFDGGSFTAVTFDGTLRGDTVTFGTKGDGVTIDFGEFGVHGLIESLAGNVTFNDSPFVANAFYGTINAIGGTIDFDPSPINIAGDFEGTWSIGVGDFVLDATPLYIGGNMSGLITTTDGNIEFINGSDFFVGGVMSGTIDVNGALRDFRFEDSNFYIHHFGETGTIVANDDVYFDLDSGNLSFEFDLFDGTIESENNRVEFNDNTYDFGEMGATGLIRGNQNVFFTNAPALFDVLDGTIKADNLDVRFDSGSPVTVHGGFGGTIISEGADVAFFNSSGLSVFGDAGFSGLIEGFDDVLFDTSPLFVHWDFSGEIFADEGNIDFTNSPVDIGGTFSGKFDAEEGTVSFDPSPWTVGEEFSGLITGDSVLFTDSGIDVGEDFSGTIVTDIGDIIFDTSPVTIGGEFSGLIDCGDDLIFLDSPFSTMEDFSGDMTAFSAIGFDGSNLTIGADFTDGARLEANVLMRFKSGSDIDITGDFAGDFIGGTTIELENSNLHVGGDFAATAKIEADSTLTFDNSLMDIDGDFDGDFESLNDNITFINGAFLSVVGDFGGAFAADNGNIKFDDGTGVDISGDFDGSWNAGGSINFDPATFHCRDFDGTWTTTGVDTIIFDGSDFTVDTFGGSWLSDAIIFQNGSTFTVNFEMSGMIESDVNNIEFNDSDVLIGNLSGMMDAEVNFEFDGQGVHNTFTLGAFSGIIEADTGMVDFDDATVDLGNFTGLISAQTGVKFTDGSLAADPFDGTISTATGTVWFDPFPINVGYDGFGGSIISPGDLRFDSSALTVLGNFSGDLTAGGSIIFNGSNLYISGVFSGLFDAQAGAIDIDGTGGNAVWIHGNFTGDWLAFTDINVDGGNFNIEGEFDGLLEANGDIDPVFYLDSLGTNDGDMIADADGDDVGDLVGTLYANGSFSSSAEFSGASVPMSFYIDGDFYGHFDATKPSAATGTGFSGTIDIQGDYAGWLTSAAGLNTFKVGVPGGGGYVLDNGGGAGTFEIDVADDVQHFEVYGMGPGLNANETVFVRAANWQTFIVRCGGIGNYVDILAGSEPGTGYIYNLRIEGPHVDTHPAPGGGMHNTVRAERGFPGKWEISQDLVVDRHGYRFNVELDDSGTRDGYIDIKTGKKRDGSVKVWYFDSEFFDNTITEITTIEWESGDRPDLYIKASKDLDSGFPAIGLIAAMDEPIGGLCGLREGDYGDDFAAGFNNIKVQRVDVEKIDLSGSARDIRFYDASVNYVTIGHSNAFNDNYWDDPVGNLRNLKIKNGDIGHNSPVGSVEILGNLTGKMLADNIYGTIDIGGSANRIVARNDFMADTTVGENLNKLEAQKGEFDADVTVYGNLDHLKAKKATTLWNDIWVGGKLKRLTMPKADFSYGYVECSRLHHHFNVLGGKSDRTLEYNYHRTDAEYYGGGYGHLRVWDIVPGSRIK